MLIKFLARGTGSAGAAVGYLLGERDAAGKPREGVEVLRGNPDMVAAVADSVSEKTISDCYNSTYTNIDQAITSLHPSYRTGIQSTPSEVPWTPWRRSRKLRRPPIQWNHEQRCSLAPARLVRVIVRRAAVPAATRQRGPSPSRLGGPSRDDRPGRRERFAP